MYLLLVELCAILCMQNLADTEKNHDGSLWYFDSQIWENCWSTHTSTFVLNHGIQTYMQWAQYAP